MSVIPETNKKICKICNKIRNRVSAGKFPNGKDTRYTDENGKQWSGLVCPDCVKEASKVRQAKKRAKVV